MADRKDTNGQLDGTSSPLQIQTGVPEGLEYHYTSISGVSAGLSMSAPAGPSLSSDELPPSRPATAMSDSWSRTTEPEYGNPSMESMEMPTGTMSPLPLATSPYTPLPVLPLEQLLAFENLRDVVPPSYEHYPQLPRAVDDFADRFPVGTLTRPGASSSSWRKDSLADTEHDEERKHIQQRLVRLQTRLDQEQRKVNEMINSDTAEIADVEIAQSVVALLQKTLMQERAKLANHRSQLPRQLQLQLGVPYWLRLTEPPSGNEPEIRAKDHKVPEPDRESTTCGDHSSNSGDSLGANAGDQQVGEAETDMESNISVDSSSEIRFTPEVSREDDQPGERDREDNASSSGDNGTGNAPDASAKDHHVSESDKEGSSTGPNKFSWADDSPSESEAADSSKISTSPKSSSIGPKKFSWADNSPAETEASDPDGWAVGLDIDKEAPTSAPVPKAEPPIEKEALTSATVPKAELPIEKEAPISAPIPKRVLSWAQVARKGMENHLTKSIVRPAKPECPPQGATSQSTSPSGSGSSSDANPHDTWSSGDEPSGGQSSSEPEPDKSGSKNKEKTAEGESPYAQNSSSSSGLEAPPSSPGDQSKKKNKNKEKMGINQGKQVGEEEKKEVEVDWATHEWPEQDQGTW